MSDAQDHLAHLSTQELAHLQEDFPSFRIWLEVAGERTRLVAVGRDHGTRPHTVVTADITELRAALTGSQDSAARP